MWLADEMANDKSNVANFSHAVTLAIGFPEFDGSV